MVSEFTHNLIQVFCSDLKSIEFVRNLGLKAIEHCPAAKRFLLKRTMGLAGKQVETGAGNPSGKKSRLITRHDEAPE